MNEENDKRITPFDTGEDLKEYIDKYINSLAQKLKLVVYQDLINHSINITFEDAEKQIRDSMRETLNNELSGRTS